MKFSMKQNVNLVLTAVLLCFTSITRAQSRYGNTEIFTEDQIMIMNDVQFATALNSSSVYQNLALDLYLPDTLIDTIQHLPLVVFVHGGSYKGGDKNTYDDYCLAFAKRGYAAATINYRTGWNKGPGCSGDPADLNRAILRCLQDTKAALRFLAYFKDTYHIDTENIFLGGESAGAADILQVAFADCTEIKQATGDADHMLGAADSCGNSYHASYRIKGCSNKSGGVFDKSFIDAEENIGVISFHGMYDKTVPIDTGAIFSCYQPVFFKDICGSAEVTDALDSLGFSYELNYMPAGDHANVVYPQDYIIERTALFFQNLMLDQPVQLRQISALHVNTDITPSYNCGLFSGAVAVVNAADGAAPYSYSSDNISWSSSNTFNVSAGAHTFFVKDDAGNVVTSVIDVEGNDIPALVLNKEGNIHLCSTDTLQLLYTGKMISLQWYKDGIVLPEINDTLSISEAGNYYAVVQESEGCLRNTNKLIVEEYAATEATIIPDLVMPACADETVILNVSPECSSYAWSTGDIGHSISVSAENNLTTYNVNVIDVNGCPASASIHNIEFSQPVSINVTSESSNTFCNGGSVVLHAQNSGGTLQWMRNGVNIAHATGESYTAAVSGTYSCTINNNCGNAVSNAVGVTLLKTPKATITASAPVICEGNTVTFTANSGEGYKYQWYRGGRICMNETSLTLNTTKSGTYKCYIENAEGCGKYSNQIILNAGCREMAEEDEQSGALQVYPNPSKGLFYLTTGEIASGSTVIISDITGRQVYAGTIESDNYEQQLDITAQPDGIYFMLIESNGKQQINKIVKE